MFSKYYIYCLFRPDGSPLYIGKGKGRRYRVHEWNCNIGKNYKSNIIAKAKRASLEIPKIVIRNNLNEEEAFKFERAFIKAIGRYPNGPLVNMTDGGEGASGSRQPKTKWHREKIGLALLGHGFSDETRAKISATKRGKPSLWNKGKSLSEEHKDKLRAAKLGRALSEEHKAKIGAALIGKVVSSETKAKMSAARLSIVRMKHYAKKRQEMAMAII